MAKSRRRARESGHKIIAIGCSIACAALNLILVCIYYFHPFLKLANNKTLTWFTMVSGAGLAGVIICLTYILYKNRQQTMKLLFIAFCIILVLEILVACAVITAYVLVMDQKLDVFKPDNNTAFVMKTQKSFKCTFSESYVLDSNTEPTEERRCIPILRRHARTMAVYLATIYTIKCLLLGSEALIILFYYMNYLPT